MKKILPSLILCFLSRADLQYAQAPGDKELLSEILRGLAGVATVMVDGDVCQRIMTARALEKMFAVDPEDPYTGSDNFDVHHEPYVQTKKTLMRLAKLVPFPVDCNLWMPFEQDQEKIQILIRNKREMSQFWTWGQLYQQKTPEMTQVLKDGQPLTVSRRGDLVSVLTPVYNSLGDIVGLVEVVSRLSVDFQENVK